MDITENLIVLSQPKWLTLIKMIIEKFFADEAYFRILLMGTRFRPFFASAQKDVMSVLCWEL
jgi:hypothetical protein